MEVKKSFVKTNSITSFKYISIYFVDVKLEKQVKEFEDFEDEEPGQRAKDKENYRTKKESSLVRLYNQLILPIAYALNQINCTNITLITQEVLNGVPFAALRPVDGPSLIEKCILIFSFSYITPLCCSRYNQDCPILEISSAFITFGFKENSTLFWF